MSKETLIVTVADRIIEASKQRDKYHNLDFRHNQWRERAQTWKDALELIEKHLTETPVKGNK